MGGSASVKFSEKHEKVSNPQNKCRRYKYHSGINRKENAL